MRRTLLVILALEAVITGLWAGPPRSAEPASTLYVDPAPELAIDVNPALMVDPPRIVRPAMVVDMRVPRRGTTTDIAFEPTGPATAGVTDTITVDQAPDGAEAARIMACAGRADAEVRAHVASILRRRVRARPSSPGLNRFLTLGASATRAKEFLTGFAHPSRYDLAPQWEFLRSTIEYFAGPRSSFRRKDTAHSGTTAGNFIWAQRFCPDCPDRLKAAIAEHRPAFAVVMFGTNNVSWGGMPGLKRVFNRRIAAGFVDRWCRYVGCLQPWEIGEVTYETPKLRRKLTKYVKAIMAAKLKTFRVGYSRLLETLLDRRIVPLLTTIPPMPRKWLDEDTVYAINQEIHALGREYKLPVIDYWCALNPTVETADGTVRLDWSHPVMTNHKGIAPDRYHPQSDHAFEISDENLVYGYNARNVVTLLRLMEMRELGAEVRDSEINSRPAGPASGAAPK